MGMQLQDKPDRVMVVVTETSNARSVAEILQKRETVPVIVTDPEKALEECRTSPPDIVVVDDNLGYTTGKQFLARLLRISWTTASILISADEEERVHENTEGLGILGSIRSYTDEEALTVLLQRYHSTLDRGTRK
jgi:DNA-binding response OmpR family regulator